MATMTLKKIVNCARCGEDHVNVVAKPLTQPVLEDYPSTKPLYTHWAPCPTNGEPILVVEMREDTKITVEMGEPEPKKEPPQIDNTNVTTIHGTPVEKVREDHAKEPVGQHKDYIILKEEERAKGFVRPVRRSYRHVGMPQPKNPLLDLTPEQHESYDKYGYVKFEKYPENDEGKTGRYWTQKELDKIGKGCGVVTTMGIALAETYAANPRFYGATMCVGCNVHLPVGELGEFVWEGTDERVGT